MPDYCTYVATLLPTVEAYGIYVLSSLFPVACLRTLFFGVARSPPKRTLGSGSRRLAMFSTSSYCIVHNFTRSNMNYRCSLKAQKGGCNCELYCSLAWQVPIEDSNVDSVALQRQVKELFEKMASLKRDRKESGQSSDACLCVCVCMSVQACVTLVQWCLNWQA